MKKILNAFLFLSISVLVFSCKTDAAGETADNEKPKDTAASNVSYPYSIEEDNDWDMNTDPQNTQVALAVIKAFENGDSATMATYLADSIELNVDNFEFKGPKSAFMPIIAQEMQRLKNVKVKMHDWESVVNKKKTEEWVTVWYTQYWQNAKGATDSLGIINDIKVKDGKVHEWNEFIRHFAKK